MVYVLEDNLRVPSGVSYMLENRQVVKRVFRKCFEAAAFCRWDLSVGSLFDMLRAPGAPRGAGPEWWCDAGDLYSAYFEHSYLAQQMGCELVEGRDLVVGDDDVVLICGPSDGWQRVDVSTVVSERSVFWTRRSSELTQPLGVRGSDACWRSGNVALANAPARRRRGRQAGVHLCSRP